MWRRERKIRNQAALERYKKTRNHDIKTRREEPNTRERILLMNQRIIVNYDKFINPKGKLSLKDQVVKEWMLIWLDRHLRKTRKYMTKAFSRRTKVTNTVGSLLD